MEISFHRGLEYDAEADDDAINMQGATELLYQDSICVLAPPSSKNKYP